MDCLGQRRSKKTKCVAHSGFAIAVDASMDMTTIRAIVNHGLSEEHPGLIDLLLYKNI